MSKLFSKGVGSILLRRLLPAAVVIPPVLAWLRLEGQKAGYFGEEFGTLLFLSLNTVLFTGLILSSAGALNRANAHWRASEEGPLQPEEHYRLLFEHNPHPMWFFDSETFAFLAVNEAAMKGYGYSREEFLSMTIKDIRPQEEVPRLLEDLAQKHKGLDVAGTWRHKKKNGKVIDVEIISHELDFNGRKAKVVLANDVTERVNAEKALKESEDRYRLVAETATDGIITIDETSKILFANPAMEKMFGYGGGELRGNDLTMLMPEYLRQLHKKSLKRYVDTRTRHIAWEAVHLSGLHKTGREIPLEISFGEIVKDGRHMFTGIVRDISDRKQAEEALRINQQHKESLLRLSRQLEQAQTFSAVLEAALEEVKSVMGYQNVWAYLFSDDGESASLITFQGAMSDIARQQFPAFQVKGDKFLEDIFAARGPVVVEDARIDPRTNKEIVAKLENRTIINVPMMLADRKIGAFGTGSFGAQGVKVPEKNQVDFFSAMASHVAVAFDRIQLLSERMRAEQEVKKLNEVLEQRVIERTAQLEAANEKLQIFVAMAQSSFDFVSLANMKGEIFYLNPGGRKLMGLGLDEEPPKEIAAYCEPATLELILKEGLPAVLQRGKWEGEGRLRNFRTGELWEVAMRSFIVSNPATGEPLCMAAINSNITDHKRAEEQVARRSEELEAVNKELEAFSYSVSHDLRAPLRHIDGYSELLQKRYAPLLEEKGRTYLSTISNAAKRMGQLIDDLLVFSRMGRAEMRVTKVNVEKMVRDVLLEVQKESEGRDIVFNMQPLPEVAGDPAMLRQVLMNLLSNAVKYTRKRTHAVVDVGYTTNGKETVFFVKDNGAGFEMKYADKLFGVFQRLHTEEEFEGTGIGLANVRRIVERHGGRSWAEGGIDQGATFYFSIPHQPEKRTQHDRP